MGDGKRVTIENMEALSKALSIGDSSKYSGAVLTIESIEDAVTQSVANFGKPTKIFMGGTYKVGNGWWDPLDDMILGSREDGLVRNTLRSFRKLKLLKEEDVAEAAKNVSGYGKRIQGHIRRQIKCSKFPVVVPHPFKKFANPVASGKSYNPRLKFKK